MQVRVINNVKKLQEVKPNFHEAFKQDGYPGSLPYQQKVRTRLPPALAFARVGSYCAAHETSRGAGAVETCQETSLVHSSSTVRLRTWRVSKESQQTVAAGMHIVSYACSQVIVLFQQQDGVDVCLYCIYVQEYGEDCPAPNR